MTDQPETMLEYHFRKLSRSIIHAAIITTSSVFLVGAGVVLESAPALGVAYGVGAWMVLLEGIASTNDGIIRRALNWATRRDISDLERPDTAADSEVLADD